MDLEINTNLLRIGTKLSAAFLTELKASWVCHHSRESKLIPAFLKGSIIKHDFSECTKK